MDEKAMSVELAKAMGMIAKRVRGDADLAADALVRVWIRLQQPGQWVSWLLVRRAIWDARRDVSLPGLRARGRSPDPWRNGKVSSLYREPVAREVNPALRVERMEAVGIVARLAQGETQRCIVDGLLDGSSLEEMARTARRAPSVVSVQKRRLRRVCRQAYPSLIGY